MGLCKASMHLMSIVPTLWSTDLLVATPYLGSHLHDASESKFVIFIYQDCAPQI